MCRVTSLLGFLTRDKASSSEWLQRFHKPVGLTVPSIPDLQKGVPQIDSRVPRVQPKVIHSLLTPFKLDWGKEAFIQGHLIPGCPYPYLYLAGNFFVVFSSIYFTYQKFIVLSSMSVKCWRTDLFLFFFYLNTPL